MSDRSDRRPRRNEGDSTAAGDDEVVKLGVGVPASGDDDAPVRLTGAESVVKPPKPEVPDDAARLEPDGKRGISGRKSVEPDIDQILEDGDTEDSLEEGWSSEGSFARLGQGWFLLVVLIVGGLAAYSVFRIRTSGGGDAVVSKNAAVERLEDREEDYEEALGLVEEAERTVRKYVRANSIDELIPLVRDPDRVRPLMEAWYARHDFEPKEFEALGVFDAVSLAGRSFWMVSCGTTDGEGVMMLVEQTDDGRMLVDWETSVCFQPMDWDRFVKDRPDDRAMDFRVYLQPDLAGLFSHEFSDQERWDGYRLGTKGSEEFLFGYAEKDTEHGERLRELSRLNHGRPLSLLLRLRVPEGSESPRGVRIEGIVSERWALVEER